MFPPTRPVTVLRLTPTAFTEAVPALAALLADTVSGGASLGFRLPFGRPEAERWWRGRTAEVTTGKLHVWVARAESAVSPGAPVLATVSLAPSTKQNGRHRAEVSKLMVSPAARGQGLARALLRALESGAIEDGLRLLVLDTETDSPAESLYRSAGWTRSGGIPQYATDPAGALRATTLFHKLLDVDVAEGTVGGH